MYNVLIIDDLPDSCSVITSAINSECKITLETDPVMALERSDIGDYSAYLVNISMSSGMRGDKLIEALRKKVSRPAPFCLMTGANFEDCIENFHSHSIDEFFNKSSSPVEIKSRFMAAIGRAKNMYRQLERGPLKIDLTSGSVSIKGKNFECTATEYRLLCNLLTELSFRDYVPREIFIKNVWGETSVEEKTLSTHLSNLNKRLASFEVKVKTKRFKGLYLTY